MYTAAHQSGGRGTVGKAYVTALDVATLPIEADELHGKENPERSENARKNRRSGR